ncbi:unnamed protein product [Ceratitis capitata]|uniref:(Mediterranean fruit fly) hypothetical protein n=1 Tax=Ceratitis capitata TaxID=7213 RepID=A0A811UWQ5_CERCA|nr:unnamed protein product [Ceratitis capitata]
MGSAQFCVAGISSDITKFNMVIASNESHELTPITEVVLQPEIARSVNRFGSSVCSLKTFTSELPEIAKLADKTSEVSDHNHVAMKTMLVTQIKPVIEPSRIGPI